MKKSKFLPEFGFLDGMIVGIILLPILVAVLAVSIYYLFGEGGPSASF
jgi:hypothetical protein